MIRALSIAIVFSLAACQSAPAKGTEVAVTDTREGIDDAVLAPAGDLNLRRKEIPPTLKALTAAYGDRPGGCASIAAEITKLTAELGLDEDDLRAKGDPSRAEKYGREASEAALDTVEGITTGFIPFRGIIRRVSGATAYEKRARAAVLTGLKRRAYLKGVGETLGCAPPAAPLPAAKAE